MMTDSRTKPRRVARGTFRPTITVDVGTSRVKLGYFDEHGVQRTVVAESTPVLEDEVGQVYDTAALYGILESFVASLDGRTRDSVECIALTGVGESGGLVAPDTTLRSPMIVWHDQRGADLLESLDAAQRRTVYGRTGLPPHPNYALSKIAWAVRQAGPAAHGAVWLNVVEHLAASLTGSLAAEPSLASRTMALDLRKRAWDAEIASFVGLDLSVFPPLRPATEGVPLIASRAARLGLSPSVRVHVVGHDHMVGGVGAGLRQGEMLNSTGTTEGLLELRGEPLLDERAETDQLANGLAPIGDGYTLFVSIPTGGSAFATLRRMLRYSDDELTAVTGLLAEKYALGGVDLGKLPVVVPHFRGSPSPQKSATARGIIANVGDATTSEDVILGCFLGMALQLSKVAELFRARPTTVKVIGPASKNPLWLQLKADVLGADLSVAEVDEVVSRGAQAIVSGADADWEGWAPRRVASDPARRERISEWRGALGQVLSRAGEVGW